MATTHPDQVRPDDIREDVRVVYEQVATEPDGDYHFHRGPAYAADLLGYDVAELAELPAVATARFAGVGNPHLAGPLRAGETVLDLGCGGGMDLLLAARRVAPDGRAIGVDMTAGMRHIARTAAAAAGLEDVVEVREGLIEDLPLADSSVDVVTTNGVINLSPDKETVFREVARVLKPGGRLHLADVVVARELTLKARSDANLWAACVAGALTTEEILSLCERVGLQDAKVVAWFDAYRGTSAQAKVSKDLKVGGATVFARTP